MPQSSPLLCRTRGSSRNEVRRTCGVRSLPRLEPAFETDRPQADDDVVLDPLRGPLHPILHPTPKGLAATHHAKLFSGNRFHFARVLDHVPLPVVASDGYTASAQG